MNDLSLIAAASSTRVRKYTPPPSPGGGWWALLVVLVIVAAALPTYFLLKSPGAPAVVTTEAAPAAPPVIKPPPASKPVVVESPEPVATVIAPPPEIEPLPPPRRLMPTTRAFVTSPQLQPTTRPRVVTDEDIGRALQRGVDFLIAHFQDGAIPPAPAADKNESTVQWREGLNALCVYALVTAGGELSDQRLGIRSPFMRSLLDHLKSATIERDLSGTWQPVTYGRSLRAAALAVYARPEDRAAMRQDVDWLVQAQTLGAYTYDDRFKSETAFRPEDIPWDNSNSQYGALGVWACAEVGIEVPDAYWRAVEKHWTQSQLKTGQWGYKREDTEGSLAMTAAGVVSLLVSADWLTASHPAADVRSLTSGLNWLEQADHSAEIGGPKSFYRGYDLFSIERAGLASGYKDFGVHDWYREQSLSLINRQSPDGSWGNYQVDRDRLIETAYDVLFLARGRHPIVLNKLRFDGRWSNHPRDAANFTRYTSHELERPLNWQVVSIDRDWTDWTDSPLLYLASDQAPNLDVAQQEKLRQFTDAGGLLFTQADNGSESFNAWIKSFAKKQWPDHELMALSKDHDIYKIMRALHATSLPLQAITNGSRLLLVHSPKDIASAWQMRADKTHPEDFQVGLNLFLYATGKARLYNRLAALDTLSESSSVARNVTIARLRYASNWNPEPQAWRQFAEFLEPAGFNIRCVDTNLSDLDSTTATLAHLTGSTVFTPTQAELNAIQKYVDSGGTLLVDDAGRNSEFTRSIRDLLTNVFPDTKPKPLSDADPILKLSNEGMIETGPPHLRPYLTAKLPQADLPEEYKIQILAHGRGLIVLSPLNLTTGLLGSSTWGIPGYDPTFSRRFVQNLIAHALPKDVKQQ